MNIYAEYKNGRKKNFFVREHNGYYFLERITKAVGCTIYSCRSNDEMEKYLNANGYKFIGLVYNAK